MVTSTESDTRSRGLTVLRGLERVVLAEAVAAEVSAAEVLIGLALDDVMEQRSREEQCAMWMSLFSTVLLALVAPGLTLVSQEDLINLEDSWGIEGEHSCRRKNDQKRQKDAALALEPPPQPPEPAGRNGAKTGSSKLLRAAVASAPAEPERTRYQTITGAKWETAEEKKEREDWEARMMLDALLLLLCYQIHKHY